MRLSRSLPIKWSPVRYYTRVGFSLAWIYKTRVKVAFSDEKPSSTPWLLMTGVKRFIVQAPGLTLSNLTRANSSKPSPLVNGYL